MKLRVIRGNRFGNKPTLHWEKILARNLNNLCLARDRRAEDLAARHFFPAAVLRWRRLIAVTVHLLRRGMRVDSD
ncbi:MAG: hypothetical protein ABI925_09660 [Verrucomicrobiota bacterium]